MSESLKNRVRFTENSSYRRELLFILKNTGLTKESEGIKMAIHFFYLKLIKDAKEGVQ